MKTELKTRPCLKRAFSNEVKYFYGHKSATHHTLVDKLARHTERPHVPTTLHNTCAKAPLSQVDCISDMESTDSDDSLSYSLSEPIFASKT